jgi:hypothetical protein
MRLALCALALIFAFLPSAARADTITLDYQPIGTNEWQLTLTDDVTALPQPLATAIAGVAVIGTTGGTITSATLTSAPGTLADWNLSIDKNTISASGCQGNANNVLCTTTSSAADASLSSLPATFTWIFDLTLASGSTISSPQTVAFECFKPGGTIACGGNTSVTPTIDPGSGPGSDTVPEPKSLVLFATGLIGLGLLVRSRVWLGSIRKPSS